MCLNCHGGYAAVILFLKLNNLLREAGPLPCRILNMAFALLFNLCVLSASH